MFPLGTPEPLDFSEQVLFKPEAGSIGEFPASFSPRILECLRSNLGMADLKLSGWGLPLQTCSHDCLTIFWFLFKGNQGCA